MRDTNTIISRPAPAPALFRPREGKAGRKLFLGAPNRDLGAGERVDGAEDDDLAKDFRDGGGSHGERGSMLVLPVDFPVGGLQN